MRHTRTDIKYRARVLARHAISEGKLKRLPCEVCGDVDSEAHHEDYSKPLEVRWFCLEHHRERHREIRLERERKRKRENMRRRRREAKEAIANTETSS
jgi:hypothetical protein